ncbi:MAG: DUF4258 domain-containing protein [Bacteroidota bacterium]
MAKLFVFRYPIQPISMNLRKAFPVIIVLVVVMGLSLKLCRRQANTGAVHSGTTAVRHQEADSNNASGQPGLNRHPSHFKYSKHAKCRMDCRHITGEEISEILKTGTINYRKSELNGEECSKKYAVEGYTRDQQHLRVIFAPCNDAVTVVTCIDLETEWTCHCEGDHH